MIKKLGSKIARIIMLCSRVKFVSSQWCVFKQAIVVGLLIAITGCTTIYQPSGKVKTAPEDTEDFPYNPVVFHLDLSILAYKLYAQSLVWPFDPYYEDQNNWDFERTKMLAKVKNWAVNTGAMQTANTKDLANYRGPGVLSGFVNDMTHDPIIYRYNQLDPWSNTITRFNGKWKESRTPQTITDSIKDVYMCSRLKGGLTNQISIKRIQVKGVAPKTDARDVILAFEGETGNKGEQGQAGSQSLLGYTLVRHWPNSEKFDVHVVFRGSRSGSASRALRQALSDGNAKGNPDWITDLGYDLIDAGEVRDSVTTVGKVFRGFAHSMNASAPQIFGCLDYVNSLYPGQSPERIFVTGHSLGGGLAQHFSSTVLMGNRYGLRATDSLMPANLQRWPWKNIKLVSFGAPRAGDELWAKTLTETYLKSPFFSSKLNPFDHKALSGSDPSITNRLLSTDVAAGYRVLISRDPITSGKGIEGKHVGKTVYLNKRRVWDAFMSPDAAAHEPLLMRRLLLDSLNDIEIPDWSTKQDFDLPHNLSKKEVGAETGYLRLKVAYEIYMQRSNIPYNKQEFDQDFKLFLSILNQHVLKRPTNPH